jgi:hypothetical protein
MAQAKVFRGIRGAVQIKGGTVEIITRGDKLPSDALASEKKRYEELGMLGDPFVYEEQPEEDVTPAEALVANPEQEMYSTPGEEVPEGISATTSNEELDSFVAEGNVDDVLEAATDAETAQALLDAEISVREEPRKSLVEGLVAKGANDPEGDGSASD